MKSLFFLGVLLTASFSFANEGIIKVSDFDRTYDFVNWLQQNLNEDVIVDVTQDNPIESVANYAPLKEVFVNSNDKNQAPGDFYNHCEGYRLVPFSDRLLKFTPLSNDSIQNWVYESGHIYAPNNHDRESKFFNRMHGRPNELGQIVGTPRILKLRLPFYMIPAGKNELAVASEVVIAAKSPYGFISDQYTIIYRSSLTDKIVGFDHIILQLPNIPRSGVVAYPEATTKVLPRVLGAHERVYLFARCMVPFNL